MTDRPLSPPDPPLDTVLRPVRSRWQRMAGSPLTQGVSLLAALIATLIIEDQARDIWQDTGRLLSHSWSGGAAPLTLAFYTCALLSGVLTLGAQYEHMRQSREDEGRRSDAERRLIRQSDDLLDQTDALRAQTNALTAETDQLRALVQSMPPANFLDVYGKQVDLCHRTHIEAYELILDDPLATEELAQMTRVILRAIGKVFAVYDNAEGAAIGVNIMLFVGPESLPGIDLHFVPADLALEELDGALLTDFRLSARADRLSADVDPDLAALALPVPRRRFVVADGKEFRCVLPGAPFAWTERTTVAYASQEELLDWCRRECAFPEQVHAAMRDYLRGRGRGVQSFVSFPLAAPEREEPIGVLNAHSDRPGLLEARPPDEMLHALLKPLLSLVVDMLELLSTAEHRVQDTAYPAVSGPGVDGA